MTILLLLVRGGGELYRLMPFASFGPQKHGAQVLLHGARTDFQMAGYFLVAAALHQQPQDLRVAGSYFYVVPISQLWPHLSPVRRRTIQCKSFAKSSPRSKIGRDPLHNASCGQEGSDP